MSSYDRAAYRWLGWGIKGPRLTYAYQYLNRLSDYLFMLCRKIAQEQGIEEQKWEA